MPLVDNDPVAVWRDSSGNTRDMVQATAASRPIFKTGIINGKNVVRFDGTDDWLRAPTFLTGNTGSIFAVVAPNNITEAAARTIFASTDEAVANRFLAIQLDFDNDRVRYLQQNADTADAIRFTTTAILEDTFIVLEVHSDGATIQALINGVVQAETVTSGADTGDWFNDTTGRDAESIGAIPLSSGTAAFLEGDLAELIVYEGTLTGQQKVDVRAYLQKKYAL